MDSDLIKESIREQGGLRLTSVDANTDDADAWVLKVQTVSASVGFWLWWFCCSTSVVCQGKCLTCHLLCIEKTLTSTMVLQQQLQLLNNGPSRKLAIRSLNFHVSSQRFTDGAKALHDPQTSGPACDDQQFNPSDTSQTYTEGSWLKSIHSSSSSSSGGGLGLSLSKGPQGGWGLYSYEISLSQIGPGLAWI